VSATISGTPVDTSRSYTFFGWSTKELDDTTSKPTVKTAGSSYTLAGDVTFYATFSYVDGNVTHYLTNLCKHESSHVETVEPTCDKNGAVKTICDHCGMVLESTSIAKLGHEYVMTTIAPTCTSKGYDEYTCSRCGDSYKKNYTETVDHEDADNDNLCDHCGTNLGGTTPPHPATCPCEDFTDVSETDWFHDPVVYMIEYGLMNGVGNHQFAPNGNVTRAMLVTILHRTMDTPSIEGLKNPFADVEEGEWYYEAIVWAAENGIVNGVSDNAFAPSASITREQIATILYRFAAKVGHNVTTEGTLNYPDADTVSPYAVDAIIWATENGIINGMDGKLAPTAAATRAQLATMLMRFIAWSYAQHPIII